MKPTPTPPKNASAQGGDERSSKTAKAKPKQTVEVVSKPRDPGRFVSQARLSEVLGWNRSSIREWTAEGMPAVVRGDRSAGKDWLYDLQEVVAWREDRIAEKVRAERPADIGDGEGDPTHPLYGVEPKDRARVIKDYANLALELDMAVYNADAEAIWVRAFRDVGNGCMSLPELAGRELAGYPEAEVRRLVRDAKAVTDRLMKQLAKVSSDADKSAVVKFWETVVRDLKGHRPEMIERFVTIASTNMPDILKTTAEYRRSSMQDLRRRPNRRGDKSENEVFESDAT